MSYRYSTGFLTSMIHTVNDEIPGLVSELLLLILFSHIKEFSITCTFIKMKYKFKYSLVLTTTVRYWTRKINLKVIRYWPVSTGIWAGMKLDVQGTEFGIYPCVQNLGLDKIWNWIVNLQVRSKKNKNCSSSGDRGYYFLMFECYNWWKLSNSLPIVF